MYGVEHEPVRPLQVGKSTANGRMVGEVVKVKRITSCVGSGV